MVLSWLGIKKSLLFFDDFIFTRHYKFDVATPFNELLPKFKILFYMAVVKTEIQFHIYFGNRKHEKVHTLKV